MIRKYLVALQMSVCLCLLSAPLAADDDNVIIENASQRTFYYALREGGGAWSETYEVAAGEQKSHAAKKRLKISYLTDEAKFAWVEPNKTYRIDDVQRGLLRTVTKVLRPAVPESTLPPPKSSSPAAGETDTTQADTTQADTTELVTEAPTDEPSAAPSQAPAPAQIGPDLAPRIDPASTNDKARNDSTLDAIFDVANRVVTIQAIADNTYRSAFPDWRERIERIVSGASEYYQRKYAVRLVLTDTSDWKYDGVADDLEARWSRLLEQSPNQVDLIVAFVGYGEYSSVQGEAKLTGQLGRAAFFGQHLMVADRKDYHENRAKTVLIHELCHSFGGFHVADQNLIMYPGYLQLPTEEIIAGTVPLGETIDEVFSITKEFDFRAGVNSLSPTAQRRIQALYRQHGLPQESRQTDPITEGFKYLERRAKIVAQQMAGRAETSRAAFDELAE